MFNDFLLVDFPVTELPDLLSKSKINMTNLHSGVWALFHIYSTDDTLSKKIQNLFDKAKKSLDEYITPEVLYDIMSADLPYYDYDMGHEVMLTYANDVIKLNKEKGTKSNA